ncbi:Uncharacterized protein SCF082_LOCUS6837 [Durusdinium trenchii]|uniref:Uncharacterized protein n=1 Tax=Durusdinium trenchii TaxID=1381693 RepID=A0ABP0IIA9_9DINO
MQHDSICHRKFGADDRTIRALGLQENRRLRVENAELKKRLYFAGPKDLLKALCLFGLQAQTLLVSMSVNPDPQGGLADGLATTQDREEFMRNEAPGYGLCWRILLDIVAFLINTLVVQYGLAEPLSGALPEEAKQEMQDVEFRIKNLKRELKEQMDKVPVPVMASGCGGCAASPSARGAVPVPQASSSEQVSPHSVREGSVTPIPRGFWVPLPSNVMSPTGQPWPPGSQLVAVQIGPAQTPPGSFSETSQQERFLPHNILSDPTTASQVSANTSNTSPDCHSSGFVVPFQGTDDRWVCIPSGIVERHKAQFEAPSTDGHEELAHSSAQASTEARGSGSAS